MLMLENFTKPKYPKSILLNLSKKLISIILTISIIVGTLFNYPVNNGLIANAETQNASLAPTQTPGEAVPDTTPKIIGELYELRDVYNKHFRRTDGSIITGGYIGGVHYQLNGKYEDIDNSLIETILPDNKIYFKNKSNSFSVKFAKNAESRNLAKFTLGDTKISWYLENSASKSAYVKSNDTYIDSTLPLLETEPLTSANKLEIKNNKGFVKYEEILPLIDLEYITVGTMVKENITLKSKEAQNIISFVYDFGGLVPVKNEYNSIGLYKQEDLKTPVLNIASPFMYDANYERSNNIEINIEKIGKEHKITLTADKTWLEAPERLFPVIIDPTLETSKNEYQIREGFVAENDPSPTPLDSLNLKPYMKISSQGNSGGYDYFGYIRFENLPKLKSSDQIINSTLILKPMYLHNTSSIYLLDNTFSPSPVINAYKVTSNWYTQTTSPILTYNTQPSSLSTVLDYETVDGSATDVNTRDYEWDVTKAAKSWFEDETKNFGIKLQLNQSLPTSTWAAHFLSSDSNYDSSTFPVLTTTYRNASGLEGYYSYHEQSAGRAGTGHVNDYTGNLVFTHNDASTPGSRFPASVSHVFGNDKKVSTNDYNDNTKVSPKYGNGWSLDAIKRIDQCSSDLIAEGFHYVLTDGDGTQHYFYRNDADPVREYHDEDGLGLTLKAYITTEVVNGAWFSITDKNGVIMEFNGCIGNGGFLKKVKDTNGNYVVYNYVNGLSGQTDEHMKLESIVDSAGSTIDLIYNSNNVLTEIKAPSNRSTYFTYDPNGTGDLVNIEYPHDVSETPKISSYSYSADTGFLANALNFDGYQIDYEYTTTTPFRVSNISEKNGSNYGNSLGITYSHNSTKFSNNNDDTKALTYQFNNYGNTVSVIDKDGNANNYGYNNAVNSKKNNSISATGSVNKSVINLLTNPSFENGKTDWAVGNNGGVLSSVDVDTTNPYIGNQGLVIKNNYVSNTSYAMAYTTSQNTLAAGTYTASCYVKTSNIAKTDINYAGIYGAGIELRIENTSVTPNTVRFVQSEFLKGTSDLTLDNGWSRISATFTLNLGEKLQLVEFGVFNSNGTAYFDGVQLEKDSSMNQYNLIENTSFEKNAGVCTIPTKWTGVGTIPGIDGASYDNEFDGAYSMHFKGEATIAKSLKQTVNTTGKEGDVYSFSAWSTAQSVPLNDTKSFCVYIKTNFTDGTYQETTENFNPCVDGWQNLSFNFIVDDGTSAVKNYTNMELSIKYENNANHMYVEAIQLYRDVNTSYQYDENGNEISTKDLVSNESSTKYNTNNQLIKQMNPDGTSFENDYDSKNNLIQSINETGTSYNTVNNSNGSPLTTQIGRKLLAYYNFNGNVDDSSGNQRNGLNHGGTFCTGKVGNAIHFDGNDDYADLGRFDVPDSFSISLWAKPQRINAAGYFVANHDINGANQLLLGYRADGTIDVNINNTSTFINKQTLGYQHIVASYQKINTNVTKVRIYKDTELILDTTLNSEVVDTSTGKNWLVGMEWDGATGSDYLLGDIDELAFFDGALGTSEVKLLYDLANKKSLVAKYTFNSDSNGKITDSSINGHNGTYSSGATFTTGVVGNALTLNGTTGYAQLDDFYIGQDLSVSMWVKPNNLNNGAYFAKNDSLGGNVLVFGNYNGMHTLIRNGWNTEGSDWSGSFKHVVLTVKRINKTQSSVNVYLDKVLIYNKTIDGVLDDTTGKAWIMGAEWDGTGLSDYLNGQIDEVAIYNYELNTTEITSLYTKSYPNSTGSSITVSDYKTINSSATYTSDGNYISTITDSRGFATENNYDLEKGTLLTVKAPNDTVDTNNEIDERTTYKYNSYNDFLENVEKTFDGKTYSNTYAYKDDLLETITHNGFNYNFVYDDFGNQTSVAIGDKQLIANEYLPNNGLLDKSIYGNGDKVSYVYDKYDQVTDLKYDDVVKFKYTYDNKGNLYKYEDLISNQIYNYTYDFIGRPVKVSGNNNHVMNFYYDNKNRISSFVNMFGSTSYKTGYLYGDPYKQGEIPGKIYGITLNGTNKINYEFDSLSRLKTRKLSLNSQYTTAYSYLDGNTTNSTTSLLGSIQNGSNNAIIYTYDSNGNILTIKEGTTLKASYKYDKLNQLIREDNLYINHTITYLYEKNGNIGGNIISKKEYAYTLATDLTGLSYTEKEYKYAYEDRSPPIGANTLWKDLLTKYGNDEINYDAIGNPLNIGNNWSFTWDNGRSLASTTKSGITSSYKYNDSGIRTSKTVGTVTTNYYLNGDSVVRETTGTDILDYFYDEKGDLFAFNYNGVGYFYVRNGQNDIIGILDASGTLVVSYVYDSWGKLIGTTGSDASTIGLKNPYRYRGYRYDNETELYYLQSRYYDPETCRMLNADVVGTVAATPMGLTDKNLFAYCDNNPVMRVDEDGQFWMLIGALAGAVVGAAAGAIISYATTGKINWWAVAGGAAAGALIGCGAGFLADKAVMASSWAAAASAGGASAAAVGRNFEQWFYKFGNVAKSMQQVAVKGIGRLDAISKGKIIELKNYDWSKYRYLNSVSNEFVKQGRQYQQLIGQKINGQVIKSVEFFFSSKPPQQVINALKTIGINSNWAR